MEPLSCSNILEVNDIYYRNLILLSYFTLYIELSVITSFYTQMAACLPFKMPDNPEKASTTHSQCFSIKARHRNDLSGHSLYPIANSQYSPQGNDALNVS